MSDGRGRSTTIPMLFDPDDFSGTVRLFPLPNLVMFPHVVQPLHVFESRYRELVEASLADDRLIAMATLRTGWEEDNLGRPALHPPACLGQIGTHHRLPDGRFNLLLVGVRRLRIMQELTPATPYRQAEAALADDVFPAEGDDRRGELAGELVRRFKQFLPNVPHSQEQLEELLSAEIPLGALTDIVAYTLDLDLSIKVALLAETNVDARAELLLMHLPPTGGDSPERPDDGGFPPSFSVN